MGHVDHATRENGVELEKWSMFKLLNSQTWDLKSHAEVARVGQAPPSPFFMPASELIAWRLPR